MYCAFFLLPLTCVLYVRLVTFDLCTVRSSCYLWLVYCTFFLLPLTYVLYVRLVTFDLCTVTVHKSKVTRRTYSTQVKGNKKNVQYIGQKQQEERTVHKSKVTRRTYSTQVKGNKKNVTCVLYVRLVTFDLCTVRSSCYPWLVYCAFFLLPLTCVLYVLLVTFDLCTVRSSCCFWPMKGNKTNVQYIGQW
jgi:hypothetical protein